jgi:hypothetical protein
MSLKIKQLGFLLLTLTLNIPYVFAQNGAVVSMGAGYTNNVYYSLQDGFVAEVANTSWDVAFTTDLFDASIQINASAGIEVFIASNDLADWSSVDTAGIFNSALYNSTSDWALGAFNQGGSGAFNYGWGTYNTTTHNVTGSRIFVLRYPDGTYKKFAIEQMAASGTYSFKYANLDGTDEQQATISKTMYSSKAFVGYHFATNEVVDFEPAKGTWDLLFTKYFAEVGPSVYYPVTGVLTAPGIATAVRTGVPVASDSYDGLVFEDSLGAIGYNWKSFNMTTFTYDIQDSLVYFVRGEDFKIQKVYFTGFEGSSTGNIDLNIGSVLNLSNIEWGNAQYQIFPNPAQDRLWVKSELDAELSILNSAGQVVLHEGRVFGNAALDISQLPAGIYTVRLGDAQSGRVHYESLIVQ